jgi:TPR repeat protein
VLGDLYAAGIGVPADPDAARRWYETAANQGHAPAQAKLAGLRGPRLVTEAEPRQAQSGS